MRLFFEENIAPGLLSLSDESTKHIVQVLRMQVGNQIEVTNGKGQKAVAEIVQLTKRTCQVNIKQATTLEQHNPDIHLAISFTKNNARIEWLLEKATEIGIRHFYPLITERSEKKNIKLDQFQKKIMSAMLQSQQYFLPELHQPILFDQLIKANYSNKYIAHCLSEIPRQRLQQMSPMPNKSSIVLIGPEGDFTEAEVEKALQQNFMSVHLGNNRLRTETAGLVALTLLRYA